MSEEKLLAAKKKMNKKRPEFIRQDYTFRMKVHDRYWRKPRGYHSKMRRGEAGKRKVVQAGYRSPAELRGINLQGFRLVHVETLKQLEKVNLKEETAILSSNLGLKKRTALAKYAAEKNIRLANIKDAKKFVADAEAQMKARKEARKAAIEKRAKPAKEEKKQEKKESKEVKAEKTEAKPATHAENAKAHNDINSQTSPKAGAGK